MNEQEPDVHDGTGTEQRARDGVDEEGVDATAATMAAVSSDYKIRGKTAVSNGAGVLGHNTAGSGPAHGVEGVTESSNGDAAAVRASAPNGGIGVRSVADGNHAVDADATGFTAIDAKTDGTNYAAIIGQNTSGSGWARGVRGETASDSYNAFGVRGQAYSGTGQAKGVGGYTAGDGDGAAGVYGEATSPAGVVHGVDGVTQSPADGAAGVHGEAAAASGSTSGVEGVTRSVDADAAGVRGETVRDNSGVVGQTYDTASNLPTLTSGTATGVFGRTDRTAGWGVVGWSVNHDGVYGRTDDVFTYGVHAENSADGYALGTSGDVDVTGAVDVSDLGLYAYLSSNQTIASYSSETLEFDVVGRDDFGGYDSSTGVYTVQKAGTYRVDFAVDWADQFSEFDDAGYRLLLNGGDPGSLYAEDRIATDESPYANHTRTMFGLSSGDTLQLNVYQDTGGTRDVAGNSNEPTYLAIHKVG